VVLRIVPPLRWITGPVFVPFADLQLVPAALGCGRDTAVLLVRHAPSVRFLLIGPARDFLLPQIRGKVAPATAFDGGVKK
jgi:hypothetical protein